MYAHSGCDDDICHRYAEVITHHQQCQRRERDILILVNEWVPAPRTVDIGDGLSEGKAPGRIAQGVKGWREIDDPRKGTLARLDGQLRGVVSDPGKGGLFVHRPLQHILLSHHRELGQVDILGPRD